MNNYAQNWIRLGSLVSGPQAVQPTGQPPAAGSGRVAVGGLNELEVDLPLLMDAEHTEDPP